MLSEQLLAEPCGSIRQDLERHQKQLQDLTAMLGIGFVGGMQVHRDADACGMVARVALRMCGQPPIAKAFTQIFAMLK